MSKPTAASNQSRGSASVRGTQRMAGMKELMHMPRLPETLFLRRPDLAHVDREQVTYVCAVCGVVSPHEVQFGQPAHIGYLRRACACETEAREKRALQERFEELKALLARRSYIWLSIRQDDLTTMTFEGFNAHSQPQAFEQTLRFEH